MMKKAICLLLILSLLMPCCVSAESGSSPLGLYTMMGDYIGIGMSRTAVESILGKPLNNPFPEPSIQTMEYLDIERIIWVDENPLSYPEYADSYYCVYSGNIVIQYDLGFTWTDYCAEPVFQSAEEIDNSIMRDEDAYSIEDLKAILPQFIELNNKYAEIAQNNSSVILISTIGFEFSTDEGVYVGQKGIGTDLGVFSHLYTDVEKYYFVNQTQYREISYEQVSSSLENPRYSETNFVGIGISVNSSDGKVEEICIKRLDAGEATKPCDFFNSYDDLLENTKTTAQKEADKWQETLENLAEYIISQNGNEVIFDYQKMVKDYLNYEDEFYAIYSIENPSSDERMRKVELPLAMSNIEASGEEFEEFLRLERVKGYVLSSSNGIITYDYKIMVDDYLIILAELERIEQISWDERTNLDTALMFYLSDIKFAMCLSGTGFYDELNSRKTD